LTGAPGPLTEAQLGELSLQLALKKAEEPA